MRRRRLLAWFALSGCFCISVESAYDAHGEDSSANSAIAVGVATHSATQPNYEQHILPLLENLCYDCHGYGSDEGGVQFDTAQSNEELFANKQLWGRAWENVLTEIMPPGDMPQPTEAERQMLSRWIGQSVFGVDRDQPDPGRVTIRRLNRVEYHYAVRDLLGVDFDVFEHFPADDTGYGFDTIGDVLSVPPTLMEKYFVAAERISDQVRRQANDDQSDISRRIFADGDPAGNGQTERKPGQIIERLATRAFRKPVDDRMVKRLASLASSESSGAADVVARAVEAILVSPRFLYRAEFQPGPDDPTSVHPLNEFALASRLSFFLWSSLPDDELLLLAEQNKLRDKLDAQIVRMIEDEKSQRFVKNFVGQWLQTRQVEGVHRGRKLADRIDRYRDDLVEETERFFAHIMRDDRDVMELLTADYSFLNPYLADLYDVEGIEGEEFRLVEFADDSPRGGLLTHGSILMITSNPDRTSPVKRGQFILDNFLGAPAPPAPPDVPDIEEATDGGRRLSTREQLAIHRADAACASCHDRMDPLGLGLENFDAIGRWRDRDGRFEVDARGELASGEIFDGVRELREILGRKRRLFYRCLVKKLMTYALGRGIEYTDIPSIESIVDAMIATDASGTQGRFSTLLMGVVQSPQFQLRRGDRPTNPPRHPDG
ncbi:MAG: DUF1592 domain-containing protein [Planctomycetota bacterium]